MCSSVYTYGLERVAVRVSVLYLVREYEVFLSVQSARKCEKTIAQSISIYIFTTTLPGSAVHSFHVYWQRLFLVLYIV